MPSAAQQVREILSTYDDVFLDCRDLRHSWKRVGLYRHGTTVRRVLACERCETMRTDTWTPTAKRVSGTYQYPAGYLIVGGGVKAQHVRETVLQRFTVFENEDAMLAEVFTSNGRKKKRARR